ncbi:MAG TPA: FliM/FliN family flagellar motor C-terminal domain-containing protein [Candidatus Baltobacteraceae bacterium]
MMVLTFDTQRERAGGRRIRRARFEPRSSLPIAAACVVANGIRETLGSLLQGPVVVRLLEPRLPGPGAWTAIAAGARCFRVCGPIAAAAFVLRPNDALALACCAFGESPDAPRDLSTIEDRVLTRAIGALTSTLAPVCDARDGAAAEPVDELRGYTTYFEVLLERPVAARIGIALSRDPIPTGSARLQPSDLLDLEVEISAEFARGTISGSAMLALHPGGEVPMTTKVAELGTLKVGGTIVARGECGAIAGRYALLVRDGLGGR